MLLKRLHASMKTPHNYRGGVDAGRAVLLPIGRPRPDATYHER